MAQKAPFTPSAELTAISIAYRNTKMISDLVLPRTPVGKRDFKYLVFPKDEMFTIPNTRVGRTGSVNKTSFTSTETPASVEDFGLEDPIPNDDIDNAPENYDPKGHSAMMLTDLIELDREKRVADLVFGAGTYGTNNKLALTGTDVFSDPASDPIAIIMDSLDSMIMRANVMTIGRVGFSALARNPKILKAINKSSGDSGVATRQQIADLFELEEILVGESFFNANKKGQNASIERVWGPHLSLSYRNKLANTMGGITFGLTAEYGTRVGMERENGDIGLRGGIDVRVGESLKELICAADCGFLIQNIA